MHADTELQLDLLNSKYQKLFAQCKAHFKELLSLSKQRMRGRQATAASQRAFSSAHDWYIDERNSILDQHDAEQEALDNELQEATAEIMARERERERRIAEYDATADRCRAEHEALPCHPVWCARFQRLHDEYRERFSQLEAEHDRRLRRIERDHRPGGSVSDQTVSQQQLKDECAYAKRCARVRYSCEFDELCFEEQAAKVKLLRRTQAALSPVSDDHRARAASSACASAPAAPSSTYEHEERSSARSASTTSTPYKGCPSQRCSSDEASQAGPPARASASAAPSSVRTHVIRTSTKSARDSSTSFDGPGSSVGNSSDAKRAALPRPADGHPALAAASASSPAAAQDSNASTRSGLSTVSLQPPSTGRATVIASCRGACAARGTMSHVEEMHALDENIQRLKAQHSDSAQASVICAFSEAMHKLQARRSEAHAAAYKEWACPTCRSARVAERSIAAQRKSKSVALANVQHTPRSSSTVFAHEPPKDRAPASQLAAAEHVASRTERQVHKQDAAAPAPSRKVTARANDEANIDSLPTPKRMVVVGRTHRGNGLRGRKSSDCVQEETGYGTRNCDTPPRLRDRREGEGPPNNQVHD